MELNPSIACIRNIMGAIPRHEVGGQPVVKFREQRMVKLVVFRPRRKSFEANRPRLSGSISTLLEQTRGLCELW
jgi:hypothetical protein